MIPRVYQRHQFTDEFGLDPGGVLSSTMVESRTMVGPQSHVSFVRLRKHTEELAASKPPAATLARIDDLGGGSESVVPGQGAPPVLPKALYAYAERHLRIAFRQGLASEWENARLERIRPILRPDIEGAAYYEVQVVGANDVPMGFIMLSTGRHDYPIVQWNTRGKAPTDVLLSSVPSEKPVQAFYWIEPNLLAEDAAGKLIAGRFEHPARLAQRRRTLESLDSNGRELRDDRDRLAHAGGNRISYWLRLGRWWLGLRRGTKPRNPSLTRRRLQMNIDFTMEYGESFASWTELKHEYRSAFGPYIAALEMSAAPYWGSATKPVPFDKMGNQAPQCAVPDPAGTPHYSQVPPYTGPNNSWFASGCGPTAWAILLGWEDRQAARGDPRFAPYWALYHQDGALDWFASDDVAPMTFDTGPQNTVMQLNRILGTTGVYLIGESEGATEPWKMSRVDTYLQRQGFMADSIEAATFDWGGGDFDSLRDRAIKHICVDQVPAVVGLGALAHYAVATETFGYWFYFNMGHGGVDDRWCAPGVFFAGTILPKRQPILPPANLIAAGGECLEIENGDGAAGTTVVTTACAGRNSQKWLLMPDNTIRSIAEKCLDVDHSNTADGVRIQSWDCNGTGAQNWVFGDFEIISRQSDRCVDVTGMVNLDGTPVQMWDRLGNWNQRWHLSPAGEIANSMGKCLNVTGGGVVNGTPVDIATCDGSPAQKWVILPGGYIQGLAGKCLTATGSDNGAGLVLSDCDMQPNQQWSLRGAIQGLAGKCLDITGGLSGTWAWNGQSAELWTCTGDANQEWTLVP